ncbi:MAG: DUF5915 domain-containing protein, partial [Pseudomonadales bacterium]
AYRLYNVVPALFDFIEDLTNWYIRLNRGRFWDEALTDDKRHAFQTLYTAVHEFTVCMAPFAPFLSETLFQALPKQNKSPESVHLCRYPQPESSRIAPGLEEAVSRMQNIILLGRQKRNQDRVKTKYPLQNLIILHQDPALLTEISRLEPYIQSELNVKTVQYETNESDYISLFARPNSPVLGKRLGGRFKAFKQAIDQLDSAQLIALQDQGSVTIDDETFSIDDILIFREAKPGTNAVSNRFISIDLATDLDDNLIAEGLAREVVSRIQKTRKELGLEVTDRILIDVHGDPAILQAIEAHSAYIKRETLCEVLVICDAPSPSMAELTIDDQAFSLSINPAG